jgi:hypothetical protein
VHAVLGCVDGDLEVSAAAVAVVDGGLAAGVLGAVEDDEDVGVEFLGILLDDVVERGAATFLFAVKDDLDIAGGGDLEGVESFDGAAECLDGAFVIAGGTGVDTP